MRPSDSVITFSALEGEDFNPTSGLQTQNGDFIFLAEMDNKAARVSCDGRDIRWIISSGFKYPTAIVESADKKIYISDRWNHRIFVCDLDGKELTSMEGIPEPSGMCFDNVGRLLVQNSGLRNIKAFSTDGTLLWEFGGYPSEAERTNNNLFMLYPRESYRPQLVLPRSMLFMKDMLIIAERKSLIFCDATGLPIAEAINIPPLSEMFPAIEPWVFFAMHENGDIVKVSCKTHELLMHPINREFMNIASQHSWVMKGCSENFLVDALRMTPIHPDDISDSHKSFPVYYTKSSIYFDKFLPVAPPESRNTVNLTEVYNELMREIKEGFYEWKQYIKQSNTDAYQSILASEQELINGEKIRICGLRFRKHQNNETQRRKEFLEQVSMVRRKVLSLHQGLLGGLFANSPEEVSQSEEFLLELEKLCSRILRERENAYYNQVQFLGFSENIGKRKGWIVWARIVGCCHTAVVFMQALIIEHLTYMNRVLAYQSESVVKNLRQGNMDVFSILSMFPFGCFEFKKEYLLLKQNVTAQNEKKVTSENITYIKDMFARLESNPEVYPLFKPDEKAKLAKIFYPLFLSLFPMHLIKYTDIEDILSEKDMRQHIKMLDERMETEINKRDKLVQNFFESGIIMKKTSPKDYKNRFYMAGKKEEMETLLSQSLGMIENIFLLWGMAHFLIMTFYNQSDAGIPESYLQNLNEEGITFNYIRVKMLEDLPAIESGKFDSDENAEHHKVMWEREKMMLSIRESEKCYAPYYVLVTRLLSQAKDIGFRKKTYELKKLIANDCDANEAKATIENTQRLYPGHVGELTERLNKAENLKSSYIALKSKYNLCFYKNIGSNGGGAGQLDNPAGVAIVDENTLWVVEDGNRRIQVFSLKESNFGETLGFVAGHTTFKKPCAITAAPDGNVFVSDSETHSIHVFSKDGDILHIFGGFGSNNGKFNNPSGLAVCNKGNLWVSDMYNHRIQVFTNDGTFIKSFGTHGDRKGAFNAPGSAAFNHEGQLMVGEMGNNRIQIFSCVKNIYAVACLGSEGSGEGEFRTVGELYSAHDEKLYAADFYNARVQVFDNKGNFLYYFGGLGVKETDMLTPWCIAGNKKFLFVSDCSAHRVMCYRFQTF